MKTNTFTETAVVVALEEVAAIVGATEPTEYWVRALKLEVIEDWRGRRALRAGDARRLLETVRAETARHNAEQQAYQQFRRDWRQAQADTRAAELAAKRQELAQAK